MGALRSPGLLRKHYSPRARLVVLSWNDDRDLETKIRHEFAGRETHLEARNVQVIAHTRIPLAVRGADVSVIPHDAEAFARAIYSELHRCDEAGAELIVVEAVPAGGEWGAIADRLERAAAP